MTPLLCACAVVITLDGRDWSRSDCMRFWRSDDRANWWAGYHHDDFLSEISQGRDVAWQRTSILRSLGAGRSGSAGNSRTIHPPASSGADAERCRWVSPPSDERIYFSGATCPSDAGGEKNDNECTCIRGRRSGGRKPPKKAKNLRHGGGTDHPQIRPVQRPSYRRWCQVRQHDSKRSRSELCRDWDEWWRKSNMQNLAQWASENVQNL